MSGVLIVGELLHAHEPLTAVVAPAQIKAWELPQNAPIPSIVVDRISRVDHQFLSGQSVRHVTERIQTTVRAASGLRRDAILRLMRTAFADRVGTFAGFTNVAVLLAGTGPDFKDDAGTIFMGSVDLRVSFNEPA